MAEKMDSINPEILKWARRISGTSLEAAYEKFGRERLSAWESGEDYPTYAQLKTLCEFYRKPVAVCFFPEPPELDNLPASFRTLPTQFLPLVSRNILKAIDEARVMQLNLYELNDAANPAIHGFNRLREQSWNLNTTASELRALLRAPLSEQKKLNDLASAFEYWRSRLHSIGIYVFKGAFKDDSVSGLCLNDEHFPTIYVNNSFAASRQVFTLFHEVYHLISGTGGIDFLDDRLHETSTQSAASRIETNCNAFAGSFLVPDEDFLKTSLHLKPTEANVTMLARLYKVSREVILRKLLNFGRITQEDYLERSAAYNADYFRKKSSKATPKGNYYNTQAVYKGKHYLELTFGQYYSKRITVFQLAEYLNMKINSIQVLASKRDWGAL